MTAGFTSHVGKGRLYSEADPLVIVYTRPVSKTFCLTIHLSTSSDLTLNDRHVTN